MLDRAQQQAGLMRFGSRLGRWGSAEGAEPMGLGWGDAGEPGGDRRRPVTAFDVVVPKVDAAPESSRPCHSLEENEVCVYCFWAQDTSDQPIRCRWCCGLLCSMACQRDHGPECPERLDSTGDPRRQEYDQPKNPNLDWVAIMRDSERG